MYQSIFINEVGWHYDQIYLPKPAVGSLLAAAPTDGGNTQFSDMTSAYKSLPEEVKERFQDVRQPNHIAFNKALAYPLVRNKEKITC